MIQGQGCIIGKNTSFGKNVYLGHRVIVEDNVQLGNDVYVDSNTIIRSGVNLGDRATIGANCIIGEYLMDFYQDHEVHVHPLIIGERALIRSNTIIYAGSKIGNDFQTGHYVSIREESQIGNHVCVGTLCNIQGACTIGNYVRLHSNVQIGQLSKIDDYVWIFPNVVLTNDPTPPSNQLLGVHVCSFAVIATGALIMPGITLSKDCLVAAGAVVGSDVKQYQVVRGNPAKIVMDVRHLRSMQTGKKVYPWRYYFKRAMPWEDSDYDRWYTSLNMPKD